MDEFDKLLETAEAQLVTQETMYKLWTAGHTEEAIRALCQLTTKGISEARILEVAKLCRTVNESVRHIYSG